MSSDLAPRNQIAKEQNHKLANETTLKLFEFAQKTNSSLASTRYRDTYVKLRGKKSYYVYNKGWQPNSPTRRDFTTTLSSTITSRDTSRFINCKRWQGGRKWWWRSWRMRRWWRRWICYWIFDVWWHAWWRDNSDLNKWYIWVARHEIRIIEIYIMVKFYHRGGTGENVENHVWENIGWILFKTRNFYIFLDVQ